MKKNLLAICLLLAACLPLAAQTTNELREKAKAYTRDGDFNNAIVVLNRALQNDKNNIELYKDLAFTYFVKQDYAKALETAKPIVERSDADVQSYQILGMIYKALEERKESEKMYRAALKKFPKSGALFNEYGEMLWAKKDFSEAIKNWEKGIEADPNTPGNYYNAAKYYYFSSDKVWGLLYGEIFINLESYSARTEEIKKLLLDGYKKLFISNDFTKNQDKKNEFVNDYLQLIQAHAGAIATGINPETLTTLRSRFILDWNQKYAARFPFRLFQHHDQLMKLGQFDAYNHWVFESATDPAAYKKWTDAHPDAQREFLRLQQNRIFKVPPFQYYQSRP